MLAGPHRTRYAQPQMQLYGACNKLFYYHISTQLQALISPPITNNSRCELHFVQNHQGIVSCKEHIALRYIDTALPSELGRICFTAHQQKDIPLSSIVNSINISSNAFFTLSILFNLKKLNKIILENGCCIIISKQPISELCKTLFNTTILHLQQIKNNQNTEILATVYL